MRYWIFLVIIFLTNAAIAEILNVPDDFETIHGAVAESEDGDTVLIAPGEYQIDTEIDFDGKNIVIASLFLTTGESHYIEETIIDGQGETRVFVLHNGETEEAQIVGLTIQNGRSTYGAGIRCSQESTPRLSHLVITGNTALNWGGGVYCTSRAAPIMTNVTITNNTDSGDGEGHRGGMHYRDGAAPVMVNSIIYDNDPPVLSAGMDVTFSDIEGEGEYEGEGNINDDPEFEDPDDGDFNLSVDSPCLDAADPDSPEDPDGTNADMGALYFEQTPNIVVEPDMLNFGDVNLGEFGERTLTIFSLGPLALEIESIQIGEDDTPFEIIGELDLAALDAGDELDVTVRFTPAEVDEFNATLIIISDDPEDPSLEIPISGSGLPAVPNIEVITNRISFEETPLQRTAIEIITISNVGMADLIVNSIEVAGDNPDAFSVVFDQELVIEPDNMVEIEIYFLPTELGEYSCSFTIGSNDDDEGEIVISGSGDGVIPEQHFDPEFNNGVDHSILVTEADLNGDVLSSGSEIGVFSPDGICCGAVFWLGARVGFAAWGDDILTEEVDGFVEDEEMLFKFWDAVSQREISAEPELEMGEAIYEDGGVTVLSLSGEVGDEEQISYTLRLNGSWNMVALPLIPDEDDIVDMWSPVVGRDNLQILKDQGGRFYNPEFGFNSIPFWDYHYGYQANMFDSDTLVITGLPIPEDLEIPLEARWNIVNYFLPFETDAIVAFSNIVDVLLIAKDVNGDFYSTEFGFSNMGNLSQGNGYQAKVTEEVDLVWNFEERIAVNLPVVNKRKSNFPSPLNTGNNMSVIVMNQPTVIDGLELLVFSSNGLLIGSTFLEKDNKSGLTIWGDDPITNEIDGALDGEELTFAYYREGEQIRFSPEWLHGSGMYQTDGLAVMNIDVEHTVPTEFRFENVHPNPFNSSVQLNFSLPEYGYTNLTVYDISGRQSDVLVSEVLSAGTYTHTWNAKNLTSGIYLIRLETESNFITQKVTLVR